jgi:hypothetical protein
MKSKNIKEFKVLILKYETITLEKIKELQGLTNWAEVLTGFGSKNTCTLCKGVPRTIYDSSEPDCRYCVWYKINPTNTGCNGINGDYNSYKTYMYITYMCITYEAIDDAKTPEDLLNAYRNRAAYMRTVCTKLRIKQP